MNKNYRKQGFVSGVLLKFLRRFFWASGIRGLFLFTVFITIRAISAAWGFTLFAVSDDKYDGGDDADKKQGAYDICCGVHFLTHSFSADKRAEYEKYREETEVERGEQTDIVFLFAGIVFCIFAERDKACQRSDESTRTADIDADQQVFIVLCKFRKQNRGGDVAYELAWQTAENEGIFLQKRRQNIVHDADPRHISGEDEKENERKKKRIIDFFESVEVEKNKRRRNDDETDVIRDPPENDCDRKREKQKIDRRPLFPENDFFVG